MSIYKINLKNLANQSFLLNVVLFGESRVFNVNLSYREICGYWTMTLVDWETKETILRNIPMVTGNKLNGAGNCLAQFVHKKIGKLGLAKSTEETTDYPNDENIQTNFALFWSDD